jgi:hypothetical protein
VLNMFVRFGNCDYDIKTKYRQLPFSENDFGYLAKHLQLPQQFLPAMRVWTCCSFKFLCEPTNHRVFNPASCELRTPSPEICTD